MTKLTKRILGMLLVICTLLSIITGGMPVNAAESIDSALKTSQAPHTSFVFDDFSGRFVCVDCGAYCEHNTSWTDGKCALCGYVCVHDWKYNGDNATCSVCEKTVAAQDISEVKFNCSVCEDDSECINGVCASCGTECNHTFNAGGHCVFCGEFGNPITFADGQNGGGNSSSNNGTELTVSDSLYTHSDDKQLWDFRDTEGMLLGRDYVFTGKFNFNEYTYNSTNADGLTRLFIWANGNVNY